MTTRRTCEQFRESLSDIWDSRQRMGRTECTPTDARTAGTPLRSRGPDISYTTDDCPLRESARYHWTPLPAPTKTYSWITTMWSTIVTTAMTAAAALRRPSGSHHRYHCCSVRPNCDYLFCWQSLDNCVHCVHSSSRR